MNYELTAAEADEVKRLCAAELKFELDISKDTGTETAPKISILKSVLAKIRAVERILAAQAEREMAAAKIDADYCNLIRADLFVRNAESKYQMLINAAVTGTKLLNITKEA